LVSDDELGLAGLRPAVPEGQEVGVAEHAGPESELGAGHERAEHRRGFALGELRGLPQAGESVADELLRLGAARHRERELGLHAADLVGERRGASLRRRVLRLGDSLGEVGHQFFSLGTLMLVRWKRLYASGWSRLRAFVSMRVTVSVTVTASAMSGASAARVFVSIWPPLSPASTVPSSAMTRRPPAMRARSLLPASSLRAVAAFSSAAAARYSAAAAAASPVVSITAVSSCSGYRPMIAFRHASVPSTGGMVPSTTCCQNRSVASTII